MGLSRQEHWSGLPCPPPGDRPDPGVESPSLPSPASAGGFITTAPPVSGLVILALSQICPPYYICYGDLWSVILDATIVIIWGHHKPHPYKPLNLILSFLPDLLSPVDLQVHRLVKVKAS